MNREELVYMLAERLRKKDTPGRLYKSSTEINFFFNKEKVFLVRKRVATSDSQCSYWISKKVITTDLQLTTDF